jgi:hypothetical protein
MSQATIPQVFVDGFRDILIHESQQKYSKLRDTVDYFSPEAETGNWDRLAPGEMSDFTRAAGGTATVETGRVWSRRIAIPARYDDGELTEVEDPSKMIIDPNSNLVRSMAMAAGRKYDDVILTALLGGALNSVRDQAGGNVPTTVTLGAGETVGDGTTAISFDLVSQAQKIFMDNDIDPETPKVMVVGPRQIQELMNLTENTSSDYVRAQQLQQYGMAPNWMGFDWIASTRLSAANGAHPATDQRYCVAYVRQEACGLHVPMDMTTFVERDPSQSYAWRPYCTMDLGAVRLQESCVVRLHVKDDDVP